MPFDLVLWVVLDRFHLAVHQAVTLGLRQVLMAPGVRANRMPSRGHLLENFRMIRRMQADGKKDRLGAVRRERLQHRRSVLWPGPVIEGQHDLTFAQEVMSLKVLKAKSGSARRVDFDYA